MPLPPACPLPVVVHVPMKITPFLQPGGVFCVFVVSLSLLLTTPLEGGEQGLWLSLCRKKTAKQGRLCLFPHTAYNAGDPGSIPGLGRSPGQRNGTPLQYSCLESAMDGEAR